MDERLTLIICFAADDQHKDPTSLDHPKSLREIVLFWESLAMDEPSNAAAHIQLLPLLVRLVCSTIIRAWVLCRTVDMLVAAVLGAYLIPRVIAGSTRVRRQCKWVPKK